MEEKPVSRKQDIIVTLVVVAIIVVIAACVFWLSWQLGFNPFPRF